MAALRQHIASVLEMGSQLFNRGMVQQCAEAYHECAQRCLNSPELPPDCANVLQQAMQRASMYYRQTGDSERSAWQLRSALDYTLNALGNVSNYGGGCAVNPYRSSGGRGSDLRYGYSGRDIDAGYGYSGGPASGPWKPSREAPRSYHPDGPRASIHDMRPPGYSSSPGWGGYAAAGLGGLAAGAALPFILTDPMLTGAALGAGAGAFSSQPGNRGSGAALGGLGGAAGGLMLAGADSPLEALSMGGGMAGGAAVGGAYGGVPGAVAGGLLGGTVGDFAVDGGPGDCLQM